MNQIKLKIYKEVLEDVCVNFAGTEDNKKREKFSIKEVTYFLFVYRC